MDQKMNAPPPQPYYPAIPQQQTHTVIVQQPMAGAPGGPLMPRPWTTDTFSCFDDCGVCLLTYFCPCITVYQVAEDLGESGCGVCCCVPNQLQVLRTKLRVQQKIQGTMMNDCCCTSFCGICTLCQMKREINYLKSSGQLRNEV